jgi:hypothetical protein
MPNARISWFMVSARECIHSENMLCDPVYNQANNLNRKLLPLLKIHKKKKHFFYKSRSINIMVTIICAIESQQKVGKYNLFENYFTAL